MPAYLDELIEAQKSRSELMKWKLIVVSVLGGAGLGFMENKAAVNFHLVLILVPLTCVYIDLLCRNLSIRRKRIIYFIAKNKNEALSSIDSEYAKYYSSIKDISGRSLESFALIWSTLLIALGTISIGLALDDKPWIKCSIIGSGAFAMALSYFVEKQYKSERHAIKTIAGNNVPT